MTLPELLQEAEVGLEQTENGVNRSPLKISGPRDPLKTPLPKRHHLPVQTPEICNDDQQSSNYCPRAWTRDDWKQLDGCFTDERLEVGTRLHLEENELAGVDDVQCQDVVAKFVLMMGGLDVVNTLGPMWTQ